MMPARIELTSPIATSRLVLRRFQPDDLNDLYAIQSRPDVARYEYWEPRTRGEVEAVLSRKIAQGSVRREGDALSAAVVLPDAVDTTSGVIGDVSFWWRSEAYRQGEIGYAFNPRFGGRGFATEAVRAVIDMAFRDLGLHRVYGRTDARNTASANLMRRLGMRQEAHFVDNEIFKGAWGSEFVFAILEDEWRVV